jgi:hypothetical protein
MNPVRLLRQCSGTKIGLTFQRLRWDMNSPNFFYGVLGKVYFYKTVFDKDVLSGFSASARVLALLLFLIFDTNHLNRAIRTRSSLGFIFDLRKLDPNVGQRAEMLLFPCGGNFTFPLLCRPPVSKYSSNRAGTLLSVPVAQSLSTYICVVLPACIQNRQRNVVKK